MKTIVYSEVLNRCAEAAGRTRDKLPVSEATMLKSIFAIQLPIVWNSEAFNDIVPDLLAVNVVAGAFGNPYQDTTHVTVAGAAVAAANGTYTLSSGLYSNDLANGYTIVLAGGTYTMFDNTTAPLYSSTTLINATWTDAGGGGAVPATTYTNAPVELGDVLGVYTANPNITSNWSRLDSFKRSLDIQVLPKPGVPIPATVYVHYLLPCPELLTIADLTNYQLPLCFGNWLACTGAAHLLLADGDPASAGAQKGLADSALNYERGRIRLPAWAKA